MAEWYQEFAPVLLRYSLKTTGDVHAAEDCTHETFVRACARRHQFRCLGQGVRPWLFTIARNVALDYRKAHRREILTADPLDRVDYGPSPEECVTIREDAGEVRLLIGMLPPDQADCVILRFFEDRSVVETAEALGRRGVAVRALQYRALRNLRGKLTTVQQEWPPSSQNQNPGHTGPKSGRGGREAGPTAASAASAASGRDGADVAAATLAQIRLDTYTPAENLETVDVRNPDLTHALVEGSA